MADDDDDETPPAKSSKKGPKKRFGERDDSDDEGDDRPLKKKRSADDEDAEDDTPRKKRRAGGGDKRVTGNEGIPLVMLLAFIGSAVALLGICAGCGWLSFAWMFPDKDGGGGGWGGGGNEFEVVSANRQQPFRPFDAPNVSWTVNAKQNPSGGGYYYVVMKCSGQTATEQLSPSGKGWSMSSGKPRNELKGTNGKLEVWVEKRQTPVGSGKVVSNVYVVP